MASVKLDYETPNAVPLWQRWNPRRILRWALLPSLVVLFVSLALFYPGLFYRHIDEVDICSGQLRRSTYFLHIRVSRSTEASALSKAFAMTGHGSGQPDWRMVNTFEGTRRISPHYSFHGAIAQMRRIEMLWQIVPFTVEAQQQVAAKVLALWQAGGSDWDAEQYIHTVEMVAFKAQKSGQPVRVGQLPSQAPATQPVGPR